MITQLAAAVAVRQDLDWTGFAIVMGMLALALLTLVPYSREWFVREGDYLQRLVDEALEVDHVTCITDGCDLVLCYCRITTSPCEGTVEPGCGHSGAFVCEDHRLEECRGCRVDALADRDDLWASGR